MKQNKKVCKICGWPIPESGEIYIAGSICRGHTISLKQNKKELKKELTSFIKSAIDLLDEFKCASDEFVCGEWRYKFSLRRGKK